jgi:branched-subunit amino acid aminotransferase/4-amino-4-deoxychorismate lyase
VKTTAQPGRWEWSTGGGDLRVAANELKEPLVVDSWLLAQGRVRGLRLHEERFRRSCTEQGRGLQDRHVRRFLAAVRAALPRDGGWFPRVEAYAGARLAVSLRPAPAPMLEIHLWVPPWADPRRQPHVKGPDLATLAALREQARSAGADDALLHGPDGTVLEAAHSAVVWWRDDVLCVPAPELPVLPSVTRGLLLELARARGVPVNCERLPLRDLGTLEVWAVNALHGIRPVVGWTGTANGAAAAPSLPRLEAWRQALDALGGAI